MMSPWTGTLGWTTLEHHLRNQQGQNLIALVLGIHIPIYVPHLIAHAHAHTDTASSFQQPSADPPLSTHNQLRKSLNRM
jgi:hypothetical protein